MSLSVTLNLVQGLIPYRYYEILKQVQPDRLGALRFFVCPLDFPIPVCPTLYGVQDLSAGEISNLTFLIPFQRIKLKWLPT